MRSIACRQTVGHHAARRAFLVAATALLLVQVDVLAAMPAHASTYSC